MRSNAQYAILVPRRFTSSRRVQQLSPVAGLQPASPSSFITALRALCASAARPARAHIATSKIHTRSAANQSRHWCPSLVLSQSSVSWVHSHAHPLSVPSQDCIPEFRFPRSHSRPAKTWHGSSDLTRKDTNCFKIPGVMHLGCASTMLRMLPGMSSIIKRKEERASKECGGAMRLPHPDATTYIWRLT